jgi:hypothetical protein
VGTCEDRSEICGFLKGRGLLASQGGLCSIVIASHKSTVVVIVVVIIIIIIIKIIIIIIIEP